MTTPQTPNIGLYSPIYEESPWQASYEYNWLLLDTVVNGINISLAANTVHSTGTGADHADVAANTVHSSGSGADHGWLGQNVSPSEGVSFSRGSFGTTSNTRRLEAGSVQQIIASFKSLSTIEGRISVSDANTTADNFVSYGSRGNDAIIYAGAQVGIIIKEDGSVQLKSLIGFPVSPSEGDIFYHSGVGEKHFYGWDGTSWKQLDN